MVKPFISFTPHRKQRVDWLVELLKVLGFDEPILTSGADPKSSRNKVRQDLERADCFLALVSPQRKPEALDPARPAPWVEQDMAVALHKDLPTVILWEKGMSRAQVYDEMALASEEVDFDNPEEVLALTPRIVAHALTIRTFFDKEAGKDYPFISDKVHVINRFLSEKEWCQVRTMSLTARKRAEHIDHSVDVGQDKSPGLSVKLADPARDLKVTCKSDPTRIDVHLIQNADLNVAYQIRFTPPLKAGETIVYRHESHHANIFPVTLEELKRRRQLPGSPAFMKDGYVGDCFDIARPIETLILEIEAQATLGLAQPQVKVFALNTVTEIEEESTRIGAPESKPRLWNVNEDIARELWQCQVTIPRPKIGYSYYLLVKPTK